MTVKQLTKSCCLWVGDRCQIAGLEAYSGLIVPDTFVLLKLSHHPAQVLHSAVAAFTAGSRHSELGINNIFQALGLIRISFRNGCIFVNDAKDSGENHTPPSKKYPVPYFVGRLNTAN